MLPPDQLIVPMRQFDPTTTRSALSNYRSSWLQALAWKLSERGVVKLYSIKYYFEVGKSMIFWVRGDERFDLGFGIWDLKFEI